MLLKRALFGRGLHFCLLPVLTLLGLSASLHREVFTIMPTFGGWFLCFQVLEISLPPKDPLLGLLSVFRSVPPSRGVQIIGLQV